MSKLKGKVAVVTGASKGIGAAIAKSLAAEGASVVVNYASSKAGADSVVSAIAADGGTAVSVGGDVSIAGEAQGIVDAAIRNYGRLDILVNNSGVYEFAPIEAVTPDQFHRMFNINVLGVLLTTQAAVKHMGDGGSVINIGSVVSRITPPNSAVYTGTKGAVERDHGRAVEGTGTEENPSQLDQPGDGGNGRHAHRRLYRLRFREKHGCTNAAGAAGTTGGHRDGGCVSGFGRFGMAHG